MRVLGLVQHRKARGHIGLERKEMKDVRAESVNGLHFQSARRLERQREQLAGAGAHLVAGIAGADILHRLGEFGVVERGPFAQFFEHAVRHVAGRRLGESDAQNARRIDAVEQQADNALRQDVGLAGAGIGRDPGGDVGIGRLALTDEHGFRDDALRAHSSVSSAPPVSDHSFTRARWS